MNRSQRRWHLIAWMVIGPAALLGLAVAVALRPPPIVSEATDGSAIPAPTGLGARDSAE